MTLPVAAGCASQESQDAAAALEESLLELPGVVDVEIDLIGDFTNGDRTQVEVEVDREARVEDVAHAIAAVVDLADEAGVRRLESVRFWMTVDDWSRSAVDVDPAVPPDADHADILAGDLLSGTAVPETP